MEIMMLEQANPTARSTPTFGSSCSLVPGFSLGNSADVTSSAENLSAAHQAAREQLIVKLDSRFRTALMEYFGRRVGVAEAQDLTQDVFERLLKSLPTQPILNIEALIFTIAANLLRDRARRARCHGVAQSFPDDPIGEVADALTVYLSPERVVVAQRTLEEALDVLDELGDRTRIMFYLYRFERLKVREIADIHGITTSAVEKQIAKALLHLANRMPFK